MSASDNVKKKSIEPTGPFAPPTPAEAEQDEQGEPMAVANDKATTHGESFVPTTAPRHEGTSTPTGRRVRDRSDENRAREAPPGYSRPDRHGFAHLAEQDAEDQPSARVAASLPREAEDDEDEARGS